MDARMWLALGKKAAQSREMGHTMHRMRRIEKSRRAQIDTFDRVIAEVIVEPRPPGRAQRIPRLQHPPQPRASTAAHEPKMTAALVRHQFENDARLAMAFDAEHNAFVGPLHGGYVMSLL
jgi:hypothetical protein